MKESLAIKLIDALSSNEDIETIAFVNSLKYLINYDNDEFNPIGDVGRKPIIVKEDAISVVGSSINGISEEDIDIVISNHGAEEAFKNTLLLPLYDIKYDEFGPLRESIKLYDLVLVPRYLMNYDDTYIPSNMHTNCAYSVPSLNINKFVEIGPPREGKNCKLPAFCEKMLSGKKLQVHKEGQRIKIFNSKKNDISNEDSGLITKVNKEILKSEYTNPFIINILFDNEFIWIQDVLSSGYVDASYHLQLTERMKIMDKIIQGTNIRRIPNKLIETYGELDGFEPGAYMLRWVYERIYHKRPYWYIYKKNA